MQENDYIIAVEKNKTPYFYLNENCMEESILNKLLQKNYTLRIVKKNKLNDEGLLILSHIYRMGMSLKNNIHSFSRKIPIIKNVEDLKVYLLDL
jgi:hypothetical protein